MARKCQQVSRTSASVNKQVQEQTQNNQHSTVDKVEEHEWQLSYVEWNVDTVRATVERMEATLMHMVQNLNSQVPRQPKLQRSQLARHDEQRSLYTNDEAHQRPKHSP